MSNSSAIKAEPVEELREESEMAIEYGQHDTGAATSKGRLSKRASLLSFLLPASPLRRECMSSSDSSSSSPSSPTSQRASPIKLLRSKSSNILLDHSKTTRRISMYGMLTGSSDRVQRDALRDKLTSEPSEEPEDSNDIANHRHQDAGECLANEDDTEAQTSNARDQTHFRPMRYEVKAELDRFFGQTKSQKRELALRTKDEEGHVWYDDIEREEFAQLLGTQVESPSCFSRRSSFASSACQSPMAAQSLHGSLLMAGPLMLASPTRQIAAPCSHWDPLIPPTPPLAFEGIDGVAFDVINRRRKRDTREIKKGNYVSDDKPMQPHCSNIGNEGKSNLPDISMPAFLPLKRHQNDVDLINEAFSNPFATKSANLNSLPMEKDASRSLQQYARRERPADLQLEQHNITDWGKKYQNLSARRASMICTPKDLPPSASSNGGDDSYLQYLQRRRSSFDSSDLSPFGARFKNSHLLRGSLSPSSPDPFRHRRHDSRAKADALLGKNAINEKLLVPAGLSTGLHVYDGVEIPCRSVHLPSDDEDDLNEKAEAKVDGKHRKSMANIKTWLKGKGGKRSED